MIALVLNLIFISLLDSTGFFQSVHKPTHCFNHTLDLVLTYGIKIEYLIVFAQNPLLFKSRPTRTLCSQNAELVVLKANTHCC